MHRGKSGWTPERVRLLKELHAEGRSYGRIARQLGDFLTRNAVCGKIHRLGLSNRTTVKRTRSKSRICKPHPPGVSGHPPARRGGQRHAAKPSPTHYDPPTSERIGIMELGAGTCRWPCGDPFEEDFGYCGRDTQGQPPYCPDHYKISTSTPRGKEATEKFAATMKQKRGRLRTYSEQDMRREDQSMRPR